jgi:predicted Rossmann fold nucleotide-binding protein DprA/Smf involved in DNA uptake
MANGKNESGDNSRAVLEKLSEKQRRVFDEMPLDRAVTVDYLAKSGIPFGEVISALTVLEIKGLVTSLPGALYIRK